MIERKNRSLQEITLIMLNDNSILKSLWEEVMNTTLY